MDINSCRVCLTKVSETKGIDLEIAKIEKRPAASILEELFNVHVRFASNFCVQKFS